MLGIDVSYAQKRIDWRKVAEARRIEWPGGAADEGVGFALIKCGGAEIGRCFTDPQFENNWHGAKTAGVRRGAYWFMHGKLDAAGGEAQAEYFLDAIDKAGGMGEAQGDLLPIVDVEWPKESGAQFRALELLAFVATVRKNALASPMIYTGGWYWLPIPGDTQFAADCPLWLAAYTKSPPKAPAPWKAWDIWQFTDKGRVAGVDAPVDLNRLAENVDLGAISL